MPTYITDGVVERGYIEGVDRLYEPVRFAYRPCTRAERQKYLGAVAAIPQIDKRAQAIDAAYTRVIVERVSEWDIRDGQGQPVPITAKAVERLHDAVFAKLADIVLGAVASDADPETGAPGQTTDQQQETAEKNS